MKSSLLLACLIFSSLNCVVSHADEKELICIDGSESAGVLGEKIKKMWEQSKDNNFYSFSYVPTIKITKDILIKAKQGDYGVYHESVEETLKADAPSNCELQIDYTYHGDALRDVILKSGLTFNIKNIYDVKVDVRTNGDKRSYIYLKDLKKKVSVALTFEKTCSTEEILKLAIKSGRLQLKFLAPSNAVECQKKALEISEQEEDRRKSNSRGV